MSAYDLINFWGQTISKWPFSGYFDFFALYSTRIMDIKQNVMSHTMMTHDKFHTIKIQNGHQSAI